MYFASYALVAYFQTKQWLSKISKKNSLHLLMFISFDWLNALYILCFMLIFSLSSSVLVYSSLITFWHIYFNVYLSLNTLSKIFKIPNKQSLPPASNVKQSNKFFSVKMFSNKYFRSSYFNSYTIKYLLFESNSLL